MKIKEYTEFLREQDTPDMDKRITVIEDMIAFLAGLGITDIAAAGKSR